MLSSPIEEIKNRLNIVDVVQSYIKIQKAGANYRALCPFHSEKKPSFFISPTRQIWHCFGCNFGGDIFKFVMKIEGVEFGDALRILAQKAGVELKRQDPKIRTERQRLYEISELACRFFEKQLEESEAGEETKKYLLNRGLKEETIKKWRLGYAPDVWQGLSNFLISKGYKREEMIKAGLAVKSEKKESYFDRFRARIIFPVFDLSSQVIGFGGRILENKKHDEVAKYVNTPNTLLYDKSHVLYGLNKAGIEIRKKNNCVLVEGYMDVIIANQAGFENVVAASGTALTSYQLNILKRYSDNLLTAFDMDIAGDTATKRGIDLAQSSGFNIKIITMPEDKDPADVISQNPQEWQDFVLKAKTIHDFYFEDTFSKFDKNTLEGKKEIAKALLPVIKRIPNKIEQNIWLKDLATSLGVREEDVLEEFFKTKIDPPLFALAQKRGVESETPLAPKTRRELLEERTIVLAIKCPAIFNLIQEENLSFFSPQAVKLIERLQNGEKDDEINCLFLKAEIEQIDNPENEFKDCLREIKSMVIKDKLGAISNEIKRAEEEKNFIKVQELVQQFNQYSKSRHDLEVSEI